MNVHLPTHMGKQAFLAWVRGREERYELADGRVVMMVGASRAHGMLVGNLLVVMHGQLDPQRWTVITDFGLDAGPETLRYPDIVVDRAGGAGGDYTATEPVMIAEVLSPTTEAVDLGDKAAEYLKLPSLRAYLILAQDRCKAWLWVRQTNGFGAGATIIVGLDKIIHIGPLSLQLPLAALYAGIDVGP